MSTCDPSPALLADLQLVVSELATNAVQAGSGRPYRLSGALVGDCVRVTVRNRASIRDLPDRADWGPSEVLSRRGRGLQIVEALADRVEVAETGGALEVTAELRLAGD